MKNKNNSYLNLKDYFENLVDKSTFINSFVGYFSKELLIKESNDELIAPYLSLFDYSVGMSGPEQNTISVRKLSFAIIFNNIPEDDLVLQYKAIDDAEDMALQIFARIKHDAGIEGHFLYNSLMKDSITIEPIELNASSYGSVAYFEVKNNRSLILSSEKWTDIKKCN